MRFDGREIMLAVNVFPQSVLPSHTKGTKTEKKTDSGEKIENQKTCDSHSLLLTGIRHL